MRSLDVQSERGFGNKTVGPTGARRHWRNGHFRAVNRIVESVALDRDTPRGADQTLEFGSREALRSCSAGVVVNFFLDHRAIEIIRAKAKRDLRDARSEHDPISLDVVKIVEHQTRDGDGLQIIEAGRLGNVRESRVRGVKFQRNEGDETVSFVLRFAKQD